MKKDFKKEEEILDHLTKAWNVFCELEREYPCELDDFRDGIHQCQRLIGMRFARDYMPDIFPIKAVSKESDDGVKRSSPEKITPDYKMLNDAAESIAKTFSNRYSIAVQQATLKDLAMARLIEVFYSK